MSLMPMRLSLLGVDRVGAGLGGARLLLEPRGLALLGGGLRAARALRRLGGALLGAALRLELRVGGCLLEPALAGQLLVAEGVPGDRLDLAGEAPQGAAGGPF